MTTTGQNNPRQQPVSQSTAEMRRATPHETQTLGQTQAAPQPAQTEQQKGGWFSDLSVPQVLAGALAAVTSMLLSNQIGIAGSVIGAAVGSVVSVLSSSFYKRAIAKSADRIKEIVVNPGTDEPETTGAATGAAVAAEETLPGGSRIAPAELRERAHKRSQKHVAKVTVGVIVVAVASALAAVAVYALVVNVATRGEGIGTKAPIVSVSNRSEKTDATDTSGAVDEASKTTSSDTTATDTTGSSSTSDSTTSSGDSSGSATDSSTSTGSSGSGADSSSSSTTTPGESTSTGSGSDTGTSSDGTSGSTGSGDSSSSGTGSSTSGTTSMGTATS